MTETDVSTIRTFSDDRRRVVSSICVYMTVFQCDTSVIICHRSSCFSTLICEGVDKQNVLTVTQSFSFLTGYKHFLQKNRYKREKEGRGEKEKEALVE